MNNLKPLFVVVVFVLISLAFGSLIRGKIVEFTGETINLYYNAVFSVKNTIKEHFDQKNEIENLRAQNTELQKSAMLLSTFASELNQILIDKNSSKYEPNVKLIKTLSYATISDYNKIWVDFDEFDKSKIYGLILGGNSAGILVAKDNKPLAIMQRDEKSIFSVFIGESRIPGVASGNGENIVVKFIPKWLEPKLGDEVFTSGKDGIFFAGVPVGKVSQILNENLYKSAVITPYADANIPAFLYVVTKDR